MSHARDRRSFRETLRSHDLALAPLAIETLQVNLTKLCNQACSHCHVDASPRRTESMSRATMESCLDVLERHAVIRTLDITGGAPELHPHFTWFVQRARRLGRRVMVRHNLTVTLEPHPVTGASMEFLPTFFADHAVDVVSSLPYYREYFTDKQRGKGVFAKSIESLRRLNALGYGDGRSGLTLNLVTNPAGAFLPAAQAQLEADFRRGLETQFGVRFDALFALTNMPIHRFAADLERRGTLEDYQAKLTQAFNPTAAMGVMCRTLISVDHEGRLHDCDFNQMLGLGLATEAPRTIDAFDLEALTRRTITFRDHCYGCTAGAGSSCSGATA
ncbi:MAG: arsenosugar biosynthesis radical SAM protein ArsS [Planctomycetes bacterium]|nr:arsenosugar biosynthesis radical SAM protein ArsS [Planctomycetota bacterium]MCB9891807.1 arsenosugar biosynthesis radical SAM protein ArsS [Planctomycetota bacterium]